MLRVLRALGLLPEDDVAALEALAVEVQDLKSRAEAEEEAFEDVPGEGDAGPALLGGAEEQRRRRWRLGRAGPPCSFGRLAAA